MVNTIPPNTGESPNPGKKWLQGAALRREWCPRTSRRKDNSEMLSLLPSAAGQGHSHRRDGGQEREGQRHPFQEASGTASLEREAAQD